MRERLFHLLDKGRRKPVIWISAPAGSGKTTLAASYLESSKRSCLWYQMDERDGDIASFFYHLGMGLAKVRPSVKKSLPLFTPEYRMSITTFARQYFEVFFSCLTSPFILILDNYQDVPPQSDFDEVINVGLSLVPRGCSVMVLSRQELPDALTWLKAKRKVEYVGWEQIRFTLSETAAMFTADSKELSGDVLEKLHRETDGWVAGIVLMADAFDAVGHRAFRDGSLPRENVFSYLEGELNRKIDAERQSFLMQIACLPFITRQIAEKLTGYVDADKILRDMARHNFFVTRYPLHGAYQYHPLLREFLLAKLDQVMSRTERIALKQGAAGILKEQGLAEEAVHLFLEVGAWDESEKLICREAGRLLAQGRETMILQWLSRMPGDIVEGNADLLCWRGACLLTANPLESRQCFRRAADISEKNKDRRTMVQACAGIANAALYEVEFAHLDDWFARLKRVSDVTMAFSSPEVEGLVAMSIFTAMAFRQPGNPDIEHWTSSTFKFMEQGKDVNLRIQAGVNLGIYYLWDGSFDKVSYICERLKELALFKEVRPFMILSLRALEMLSAFFMAKEDSQPKALELLTLAEKTGVHVLDMLILGHGASRALSVGDKIRADELLEKMKSQLEGASRFLLSYYQVLLAWRAFGWEEWGAAYQHLLSALEYTRHIGWLAWEAVVRHGLLEIMRLRGESGEAEKHLARSYEIARSMKSKYIEFFCRIDEVQLLLDRGDDARAAELLTRTMALGKKQGYVVIWLLLPSSMIRICERALLYNIEPEYVSKIIFRLGLRLQRPPLHVEYWPWLLKIRTLGAFSLTGTDEAPVDQGRAKRPLELLKAIIALGGDYVAEAVLTDQLWPEADGDMAKKAFNTTLHRLRKLLGDDRIVQYKAGHLFLDLHCCWVDVLAFDATCNEIEELLRKIMPGSGDDVLVPLFERLSSCYQGNFLPNDLHQPWVRDKHEYLKGRHLDVHLKLGGYWEAGQQWERAIETYERALLINKHREECYQRLMFCYDAAGQTVEAIKTFHRCRAIFVDDLHPVLSGSTMKLYRNIIAR